MSTDEAREEFIRSYLTEEELTRLVAETRAASPTAVATYSKFYVGACLLTHEGEYITGVNIENISYTQTIHAEGCAISKAISAGKKNFKALGVYSKSENFDAFCPPCGECRQFLAEFCNFLPIVLIHESGALMFEVLHEILPLSMVLGSTAPTTTKSSTKYDDLVFKANGWILKDIYGPTRNEMKQLLRDWKFDDIQEITKEKLQIRDGGVISTKFGAGQARINFLTVQELIESLAYAQVGAQGKITVVQTGDDVAKSVAHRIVATLRAHKRTVSLAGVSSGNGAEGDVEIHVSSKGNNEIEIKFVDGKGAISNETIQKVYQEREKILCSTMLNEFYDYKTNRLLKE